jgi:hypothetical protein
VSARDHVVVDGEVYAVLACPRREIVRAWRPLPPLPGSQIALDPPQA